MNRHRPRSAAILKIVVFIVLVFPSSLCSQHIGRAGAEAFVRALIWNQDSVDSFLALDDVRSSHRLGIAYDGVERKCLISFDFDDTLKTGLRDGRRTYALAVDTLDEGFSRIRLSIDGHPGARAYYFKHGKYVSPISFLTRSWRTAESPHFRFVVSDTTLFHPTCVGRLESFLRASAARLGFSREEMETLERGKIAYYLCRDEDEIERLTGFRSRGQCNLAYDAVVSTYSTHEHELLHLLINFKLRHLPLYTHPLLQEGFAVAFGGRGGIAPGVALELGEFLEQSGMEDVASLLNADEFRGLDPSISYPLAGLYVRFLFEQLGTERFLRLYRAHCGAAGDSAVLSIRSTELPPDELWTAYLQKRQGSRAVTLNGPGGEGTEVYRSDSCIVTDDGDQYEFLLKNSWLAGKDTTGRPYRSTKFRELYPGARYGGEEFLIRASSAEIGVYDLWTNTLLASCVASFVDPTRGISRDGNGMFRFAVRKEVFIEPLDSMLRVRNDREWGRSP